MNEDTRPTPIIPPTEPPVRNLPQTSPAYPYQYTPMIEPTTPTFPPYNPYESLSPYAPPPPPMKRKKLGLLWLVLSVLLLSIIISTSFVVGRLSEHQTASTSAPAHTTPSPTVAQPTATLASNTPDQEYTADKILQDFIMAGASPTVQDHNITIWNWTKELGHPYFISVHAKSSVTFTDSSACTGPCDGFLNGGIWVYSDYATTYRAYEDASTDQVQQSLTPATGPEIIPSVYRHGRCVFLGSGNDSIYINVVTQYCV